MPADAQLGTETMTSMAAADVERYVKMRARLVAASEALARATSAESAAAAAGSALVSLTGADHAAVFFRSTNGVVTCPWYYHLSEGYVRELITPEGENPWIHLVRHPELACMDLPRGGHKRAPAPWLLPDVCELPIRYAVRRRVQREGMRSICSWPLTRAGRTIGVLAYYYDTPHISSVTEQEILRVFASQAAMAVEHGITARGITARAPDWSAARAETPVHNPVRLRAGLEIEAVRLAETLREQDLGVERPPLTDEAGLLPAESRRLADAGAVLAAEHERLAEAQRALRSEAEQLTQARQALHADAARVAALQAELTAEGARLTEARGAVEEEQARLIALRQDWEGREAHLAQERAALSSERARLAAEHERLADAQRALRSEAEQLTQARQTLTTDAARVAALQAELTTGGLRLTEAREHLTVERTQLADLQAKLDAAETVLDRDRKSLETEDARIFAARQELEAARAQMREADTAQSGLVLSEQRRLADARRAVEEEQARLIALRHECEGGEARLAQERAALTAERARLAAEQASHTAEVERLAQAQRQLEGERAQLSEIHEVGKDEQLRLAAERMSLQTENRRLADAEAALAAEHERLADAKRALRSETDQLTQARQTLDADAARVAALQAELTAEGARLTETRERLNAERTQLKDVQTKLDATEPVLDRARRPPETENARISAARQEPKVPQDPAAEADIKRSQQWRSERPAAPAPKSGEATYRTLVQRIGAPEVEDDDRQIAVVADLLDARNGCAEGYSKCLVGWVETLARELSCSESDVQAVRRAALLHGIGTIDVPESTLRLSSDVNADEQAMLREQPVVAFRMLNGIVWLRPAAAILRRRFERWDGTGHPDRLQENAIPLGARMLAVVEAYGAMVMGRPGAPTLSSRDAITGLKRGAGTRFDPAIVGAFCQIIRRARVGRVAAHDSVVAQLKDMATNVRRPAPMNREDDPPHDSW